MTHFFNLHRYAYSEDTSDEFDEEAVPLTNTGLMKMTTLTGDTMNKLERKERKATNTSDHMFGLVEDREEDKRE